MNKPSRQIAYTTKLRKAQGRFAREGSGTCTGVPVRGSVGGTGKAPGSVHGEEGGERKQESVAEMERQVGH